MMNSVQAKSILELYRSDCDEITPEITAAMAQLDKDPQLKRWYTNHQKNEQIISLEINSIKVPPINKIQSHAQVNIIKRYTTQKAFIPISIAAAVMLAFYTLITAFQTPTNTFDTFRYEMVSAISTEYQLNITATDLIQVRTEFQQMDWPSNYIEPTSFNLLHTVGGLTLTWQNNKVSTLCLETENGEYLWLFIIDNHALQALPSYNNQLISIENLMTTSWTNAGMTYLLVAEGGKKVIRQYL